MRQSNKHNSAHTEQRDGKPGVRISDYLLTGKVNAIPAKKLVDLVGCGSQRELRQLVAAERKAGTVICSSMSGDGGYYLPANRTETAEFCKTMENHARNVIIAIQGAKRALGESEGQQDIFDQQEELHEK